MLTVNDMKSRICPMMRGNCVGEECLMCQVKRTNVPDSVGKVEEDARCMWIERYRVGFIW